MTQDKRRILRIRPRSATPLAIRDLERRSLISVIMPRNISVPVQAGEVLIDEWYTFNEPYKLVNVAINWTHVTPAWHPDTQNELVMLLSGGRRGKPLFFVFGLCGFEELEHRAKLGMLTEEDFVALEWPYDDPELSCFVVRGGTVHCEVTTPGSSDAPHFFVVEPQRLETNLLDLGGYTVQLER